MRAILRRFADTPFGVFGYLDLYNDAGELLARLCTAEDDWLDNAVGKSCIPAGTYLCRRSVWHKTAAITFEITGVPGRSRILFHPGNTEENVEGCVLVGTAFGALQVPDEDVLGQPLTTKWSIKANTSRPGFERFMQALQDVQDFPLVVEWAAPGSWRAA